MTFSDLHLCAPIQKALQAEGYTSPTPIQEQAIPAVLEGRDVFGCAQTGTGKTAAFALPILNKIADTGSRRNPRFLILAPTRELAVQINESIHSYGRNLRYRHMVVYGGVSMRPQIENIRRGVDIIVATPGRLLDLIEQGVIRLDTIECLVLDEADRMMDMGFIVDIKRIVKLIPEQRQTLFFSATVPPEIVKLANTMVKDPVHISVTPVSSAVDTVEQLVFLVQRDNKRALLAHLITNDLKGSVLVFTRTKRGADRVAKDLATIGVRADAIHGDKTQHARQRALNDFKSRRTTVLVATDVAARGIDIDELPFVINYDVPDTPETYVHRIGRTGRAGNSGTALTLVSRDDAGQMRDIEKSLKKRIEIVKDHPFTPATSENSTPPSQAGSSSNNRYPRSRRRR